MTIKLYFSTVSSNLEIKKQQQRITMVLDGKKIEYNILDISSDDSVKEKMRELAGEANALPPQICNEDQYCGDFDAFDNACEMGTLQDFLKL